MTYSLFVGKTARTQRFYVNHFQSITTLGFLCSPRCSHTVYKEHYLQFKDTNIRQSIKINCPESFPTQGYIRQPLRTDKSHN